MPRVTAPADLVQHAPENAMTDADEIAAFHDRCSDLMRTLLAELARVPGRPRTLGEIEDAIGWAQRRGPAGRRRGAPWRRVAVAHEAVVGPPALPLPRRAAVRVRALGDVDGRRAGARRPGR